MKHFRFCFSLLCSICLLLSMTAVSTRAKRRSVGTQISSSYGQAGGQASWQLVAPATQSINGVSVTTQTVCHGGFNTTLAGVQVCTNDYVFLYQIGSGPQNLVLTFSGLSGISYQSANPSFGVLYCDTADGPTNNMLCTQGLDPANVDDLNISYDSVDGNMILTVPSIPANATLTFFLDELPAIDPSVVASPLVAPALSIGGTLVSPPIVAFGSQESGTVSAPQVVSFINSSDFTADVNVSKVVPSAGFTTSGVCAKIAPGGSCPVTVSFAPSTTGNISGTLTATDDTPAANELAVLSGTATSAGLTISPSVLFFGSQPLNTTSAPQTVAVSNSASSSGSIPLAISIAPNPASNLADYTESDDCGTALAPGSSCTINVTFIAGFPGTFPVQMQVTDASHFVVLSGNVTGANTTTSSASVLAFTNQALGAPSSPQSITVTNATGVAINVASVNTTSQYTVSSDSCSTPGTIPVGGTCQVAVAFAPTLGGLVTGTLTVANDAVDGTLVIPLTGTGVLPVASVSGSSLDFGGNAVDQASQPKSVTVLNAGTVPLTFSAITISGTNASDFSSQSGTTCTTAAALAVGASCSVAVVFTPSAGGARSATLSIADFSSNSPHQVALTGSGTDFSISANPTTTSISRGSTASVTVTLTSQGGYSGTLQISCTGAPSESTCSANPTSVTVNGTTPGTVALSVKTTAASFAPMSIHRPNSPADWIRPIDYASSLLILMATLLFYRLMRRSRIRLLTCGALLAASALCISCGGSSTSTTGGTKDPGTPTGTSTIVVSATDGSLTHSVSISLDITP
jgi:hypothetical protein